MHISGSDLVIPGELTISNNEANSIGGEDAIIAWFQLRFSLVRSDPRFLMIRPVSVQGFDVKF